MLSGVVFDCGLSERGHTRVWMVQTMILPLWLRPLEILSFLAESTPRPIIEVLSNGWSFKIHSFIFLPPGSKVNHGRGIFEFNFFCFFVCVSLFEFFGVLFKLQTYNFQVQFEFSSLIIFLSFLCFFFSRDKLWRIFEWSRGSKSSYGRGVKFWPLYVILFNFLQFWSFFVWTCNSGLIILFVKCICITNMCRDIFVCSYFYECLLHFVQHNGQLCGWIVFFRDNGSRASRGILRQLYFSQCYVFVRGLLRDCKPLAHFAVF